MAMTLRLSDDEAEALRRRAEFENRSMQIIDHRRRCVAVIADACIRRSVRSDHFRQCFYGFVSFKIREHTENKNPD
jgi:hypothetical protein